MRAQQCIDLQNRITELSSKGQLGGLTKTEIALISYALGFYTAGVMSDDASAKTPEDA